MQSYPCSWSTRELRQKYIVVFVFVYFIVLHVFLVPFASFWVVSLVVVPINIFPNYLMPVDCG